MQLSQFHYDLPPERIAQTPLEQRDQSRLLVLSRKTGEIEHRHFYDIVELLEPGDLVVMNNTKVLPVRLFGKKPTGGKLEVLLTKRLEQHTDHERWQALTRPGLKVGQFIDIGQGLRITCTGTEGYARIVETSLGGTQLIEALNAFGEMPTPPYIHEWLEDANRYQTVYAQELGSAAAPTAGLHFTPELLEKLQAKGVRLAHVTLHVGLGTFLPVKEKEIENHHMHSEWFDLPEETAQAINETKATGHKVVAVGTTTLRTLEAAAARQTNKVGPSRGDSGKVGPAVVHADSADTDIFIKPPYQFAVADALITNFHLPESTLLMLVSAFMTQPQSSEVFTSFAQSRLGRAYQEAIDKKYRFFSFGDAMFIHS